MKRTLTKRAVKAMVFEGRRIHNQIHQLPTNYKEDEFTRYVFHELTLRVDKSTFSFMYKRSQSKELCISKEAKKAAEKLQKDQMRLVARFMRFDPYEVYQHLTTDFVFFTLV